MQHGDTFLLNKATHGGLFVFDAWFGPAVLTERPADRYRIVEADGERIVRFAHPELDLLQHSEGALQSPPAARRARRGRGG